MSRVTKAEWYHRVNSTWPQDIPTLTGDEAIRAARRLYRFGMHRTFRGPVRLTSGNRYTWIRRGEMVVNPGGWQGGWKGLVHMMSHYCHSRMHNDEQPHGSSHARLEIRMIKEVIKRGWMNGKLKTEPKPPKPKPDKLTLLFARRKRWTTRARRAATALRKINRSINRLDKSNRQ